MKYDPRVFGRPVIIVLLTFLAVFTLPEFRSVRAQEPNPIAYFGRTVAGVGDNILVGAPNNFSAPYYGAAYLFDDNGNLLTAVHGQSDWGGFGGSVTGFGNTILVGAPFTTWDGKFQAGAAYVYDISGNLVTAIYDPSPKGIGSFGFAMASVDNDFVISAPFNSQRGDTSGIAYLFDNDGNLLTTFTDPSPGYDEQFGLSVAALGSNIIVGAPGTGGQGYWYAVGAAYLYDNQGNLLRTFYEPTPAFPDFFGGSVAGVGDDILIGAPGATVNGISYAGAAYLFDTNGNLLTTFEEPNPASGDQFGMSVASVNGQIVIGASSTVADVPGAGIVYIFDINGNLLSAIQAPSLGGFGVSISQAAGNIIIGAPGVESFAGATYVYDTQGNLLQTLHPFTTPAQRPQFVGFDYTSNLELQAYNNTDQFEVQLFNPNPSDTGPTLYLQVNATAYGTYYYYDNTCPDGCRPRRSGSSTLVALDPQQTTTIPVSMIFQPGDANQTFTFWLSFQWGTGSDSQPFMSQDVQPGGFTLTYGTIWVGS